jgi:Cu(I)/Ag(I) efflux system membrane fusion protein
MRISPGWLTFIVGLVLLLLAGIAYQQTLLANGAGATAGATVVAGTGSSPTSNIKYVCPMRCVEADEPGSCPVCGMDMAPIEIAGGAAAPGRDPAGTGTGPTAAVYTCPMHPQIVQDRPGTCPICAMELVLRDTVASDVDPALATAVEGVKLSPTQAVLADVTPVTPTTEHMALTVPAIGEVQVPEGQMEEVVAWQDGRVDNLLLDETGGTVRAGEHIMDVYSEDLVAAQEEYLLALEAVEKLGDSGYETIASSTRSLLDASRQKLARIGMTPEQIAELDRTRKAQEHVEIHATAGGVVMDKKVTEGMYVMRGEELFTVADLDPVWVEVQVFERDAAGLKAGDRVTLKSPVHPDKTFSGRIELIMPELDMDTRTYRARVEVANPSLLLRPGMVLDASLAFDYGDLLLLPRNAVLHTGDGDLVYVSAGDGLWSPRRVTVGRDFGDRVEITSGLKPGEQVAGTAVFLLDSEAQLKGVPRPVDE